MAEKKTSIEGPTDGPKGVGNAASLPTKTYGNAKLEKQGPKTTIEGPCEKPLYHKHK
jgi:hypothetical protein